MPGERRQVEPADDDAQVLARGELLGQLRVVGGEHGLGPQEHQRGREQDREQEARDARRPWRPQLRPGLVDGGGSTLGIARGPVRGGCWPPPVPDRSSRHLLYPAHAAPARMMRLPIPGALISMGDVRGRSRQAGRSHREIPRVGRSRAVDAVVHCWRLPTYRRNEVPRRPRPSGQPPGPRATPAPQGWPAAPASIGHQGETRSHEQTSFRAPSTSTSATRSPTGRRSQPPKAPDGAPERRLHRARRRRLLGDELLRRADRHAEHRPHRGRRRALHAVAHDRALLADPLLPADRAQPHPQQHGLHHRGGRRAIPTPAAPSRPRTACCPRSWASSAGTPTWSASGTSARPSR